MTHKEILDSLLAKIYGQNETEINALLYKEGTEELNETALEGVLSLDVERVKKLKPNTKEIAAKAKADAIDEFTKTIKSTFEVESDKSGVELINDILLSKATVPEAKLTEEAIKKSKPYIELVEKANAEKIALQQEFDNNLNGFKSEIVKKETFNTVEKTGLSIFDSLKPILPEDASKAAIQKQRLFIDELAKHNYRQEDGKIVLLDADGNYKQDAHGNRILFETFAKEIITQNFDLAKAEHRESAGNDGTQGKADAGAKLNYTTEQEWVKAMSEVKDDPAKSAPVLAAFRDWAGGVVN